MKSKWEWELELAPEPNLAEELQNIIFEFYNIVFTDPDSGQRTTGANKQLYEEVVDAIRRRVQFVRIDNNVVIQAMGMGSNLSENEVWCGCNVAQAQLEADSKLLDDELELLKDVDDVS